MFIGREAHAVQLILIGREAQAVKRMLIGREAHALKTDFDWTGRLSVELTLTALIDAC